MLLFNDQSMLGNCIKQILNTFNLPVAKVWDNKYLEYSNYINNLIFIDENKYYRYNSEKYPYKFGMKIENITKNCRVDNLVYDAYTHRYLGEYLRFIRDYKNIDLMSMYNCFTNETVNNLNIEYVGQTDVSVSFNSSDPMYKIYKIPVKLFSKYTIAIDCNSPIYMICGFYNDKSYSVSGMRDLVETFTVIPSASFDKPFLYDINNINIRSSKWFDCEKDLSLFIRIPTANTSSIVILEGDYTSNNSNNIDVSKRKNKISYNYTITNKADTDIPDDVKYISRCQLLDTNTHRHYLVADRLIEYLVSNVIDNMTDIQQDVKALQLLLSQKQGYEMKSVGNWDNDMKDILYKIAVSKNLINTQTDILGYFDKDIEDVLPDIDAYKDDNRNLEEYK